MNTFPTIRPDAATVAAWAERRVPGSVSASRSSITVQHRAAALQPASYDADARTIAVTFTTGAAVARSSFVDGDYSEVLLTGSGNVRLERLNAGAPLLDSHDSGGLANVLGAVVPGSARMAAGQGVATVRLSDAARAADSVADIRDGVIRNVSVGYLIHAATRTEADGVVTLTVTDWEPVEISAVAVPADAGAQFRAMPIGPARAARTAPQPVQVVVERFRSALAGEVKPSPTTTEATTRKWAQAMRASGSLGTTEAGRQLAARHGVELDPCS